MTEEELNCDKHRKIDQDPEDDRSSTESPEIISSNELKDSRGAYHNSIMETTLPEPPDVARSITPTPCSKPGMTGSKIKHEVYIIIPYTSSSFSCFSMIVQA